MNNLAQLKTSHTDNNSSQKISGMDCFRKIMLARVYDIAKETELTSMRKLSEKFNHKIYLKREDQQSVQSFKIRGAYNKLANLAEQIKVTGVVAASAGNHAQGLALAAKKLGISATIFMPITTPEIKVKNVKFFGATVKLIGKNFDEAQAASKLFSQENNQPLIHPFDDIDVIAGQGTVAKELMQQLPNANIIFIPVGGGGLLAGMAAYIKQLRPETQVIGVEAEDSACLKAAFEAGKPIDLEHVGLFADGVAVKRIGNQTFNLIEQYCDQVITVTSDEICAAIKDVFEQTRVIAEPAGALSLAGLNQFCLANKNIKNQSMVAILSGANMSFHNLRYVSERCELGEQKEAVLAVSIAEEKGSFKRFCQNLDGRMITEFNYRYVGKQKANIFVGVRLGEALNERKNLVANLKNNHYSVKDFTDNELAKLHIRYMIGGSSLSQNNERIFRFQFPEYPGALENFLDTLGELWNITLFHYRNHGAAFGQVLAGFEISASEQTDFFDHLKYLDYEWQEETDNLAYQDFLGAE